MNLNKGFKRKRLFYDIETSPNVGLFWRTGYKLSIGHDNIIKERGIICVSYKWEGGEVHTLKWDSKQSDKKLLKKLVKILNKADEIVAHNGDKFDIKWIKGRCLYHRIPVPPKFITVDTCTQARKHFNLNSNRLDYIAKYLGLGGKLKTGGFDLWKDIVLDKCSESMDRMIEYCERDVTLLEEVYNELKPYIDVKFNYAVSQGGEKYCCPECGSGIGKVKVHQTITTAMGSVQRRMSCRGCGKYYTISNRTYMDLLTDRIEAKSKSNG